MNEDLHELEEQLQSFQPLPASPELRKRVTDDLQDAGNIRGPAYVRRRRLRAGAILAAAAIILLALGLAWWQKSGLQIQPGPSPKRIPQIAVQHPPMEDTPPQPRPTRWAYQLAAADSPERLDALLDMHATQLLPPSPKLTYAGVLLP